MQEPQTLGQCKPRFKVVTNMHILFSVRMFQRHTTEAEDCLRQAIVIRERWYGKSHPLVAEVLNVLAGLLCHPDNKIRFVNFL